MRVVMLFYAYDIIEFRLMCGSHCFEGDCMCYAGLLKDVSLVDLDGADGLIDTPRSWDGRKRYSAAQDNEASKRFTAGQRYYSKAGLALNTRTA